MIPPWADKEFQRVPKFTAEELAEARAPLDTRPIPTPAPEVKPTTITLAAINQRKKNGNH